jgi:alkylated DNA nucleotide flippase Atl1
LQAAGVQRWLVVDGQQRLTTLMLALTAIRDHVANEDRAASDRIHRQYLVNEFRQGDDHLRLLPTQADRDAYRALVLQTAVPVQGSIADAYNFFRRELIVADDPDDRDDIARIEQVIRAGLSIVEITADKSDNVYRIFESLNNTGLKLSQADLLRNYLFMRLPTHGGDVYRDIWLPMQDRLSPRDLELLVWLDLIIRGDDRVKQTEIYRAQQQRLEEIPDEDEKAVEQEIVELARRSKQLARILEPSRETRPELRAALERLRDWGAQTAYPLVLHILDLVDRGIAEPTDAARAIRYIESFLVRRMLCQVPPNNLNRVFSTAPTQVGDSPGVADRVQQYLSGRRRYWPSDAEVRRSARSRPFYWTGRGPQRTYILRKLEESYGALEPVDFDKAKLTIEHVLPQTLNDEWTALLAAEVTDEAGPKEMHDLLVHTLGNMTLTAENARLSNHPFERKLDIFKASALRLNREISETEGWGKKQILERADRLAERIVHIWPGPLESDDTGEGRDWSALRAACAALPTGTWTSYGDLAELIGSHPVPVGVQLATRPLPNAWRVLTTQGKVSPQFRWLEANRDERVEDVLSAEGVQFTDGRADPTQRISARELAELLGMEVADPPGSFDGLQATEAAARFFEQLTTARPHVVAATRELLDFWQRCGGTLDFGSSAEVSCSLMLEGRRRGAPAVWPLTLYPQTGTAEVVFQHMRRRPVFDDLVKRQAFRDLLGDAGIRIPDAKLNLRPPFSLDILTDDQQRGSVMRALDWFATQYAAGASDTE